MTDHLGINKQSKLFQKFINQKNHKTTQSPPLQHKHSPQNIFEEGTKEKQESIVNRTGRSVTEFLTKTNSNNTSINYSRKDSEKRESSAILNPTSMINNPLNFKNNLGLDQILRRAIQKVREGKVQDLFQNKKEEKISPDKVVKQSPLSQKQEKSPQKQQILQSDEEEQEYNTNQRKRPHYQSHNYENQTLKFAAEAQKNKQIQELKLKYDELFLQNDQLITELEFTKQKQSSLLLQNKKLKSEINKANKQSQDLLEQNKDMEIQIKELQILVAQKQNQVKTKNDDANYWKNQFQLQKVNIENLKDMLRKAEEDIQRQRIQNASRKKDRVQNEAKIVQLNLGIAKIKQENTLAKGYLYEMTIKLYNYQQEIYRLRSAHLKNQPESQNREPKTKLQQFSHLKRQQQSPVKELKPELPQIQEKGSSAFGQVNVAQTIRPVRNRCFNNERQNANMNVQSKSLKSKAYEKETDTAREFRVALIEQQLNEIKQMSFINGKIRRRKIQLQRQLQQLKL